MSHNIHSLYASATEALAFQRPFYEDLHQHPELSGFEEETAKRIARQLENYDCEVITGIGGHGVVGIFRNGEGPTVLMRADFDGLPVKEETGVAYASTHQVPDAEGSLTYTMHACGHDMHVTATMGLCALLDGNRDMWKGTFVALFQPSEENGAGAAAMVADGLTEKIPHPDVCLGQHVMPGRAGQVATKPGPILTTAQSIRITIPGVAAHGSMPHNAVDATYIAASVVLRMQGLVGREVDPHDFAVISVGVLRAGNAYNIIPGSAEIVLNCRFTDMKVRDHIIAAIERVVRAECQASNAPGEPTFEYFAPAPLTLNTPEVFDALRPVFDDVFGEESVDATEATASEDFSHIPVAFGAPYMFWFVGCTPAETWDAAEAAGTIGTDVPVNHMSDFLPDYEPTVEASTKAAAAATLHYLGVK